MRNTAENVRKVSIGLIAILGLLQVMGCPGKPVYPLCKNDTHCKTGSNGEELNGVCVNGTCQQCVMNTDCKGDEKCVENSCVASNLPGKDGQVSDNDENSCLVAGGTVHFEFDQYEIKSEDNAKLDKIAQCVVEKNSRLVLEGNTDERGSTEYNLALGQRRAESVAKYLANNGVLRNRMKTVSYGKERPVDTDSNEDAWAKNRRAEIKTQ